jgi:hypothetical protein
MVKTASSTTPLNAISPEMFKIMSTTRLHLNADTMHFTPVGKTVMSHISKDICD